VTEQLAFSADADGAQLWFIDVNYLDAPTEKYAIPVKMPRAKPRTPLRRNAPHAIVAHFGRRMAPSCAMPFGTRRFARSLFDAIVRVAHSELRQANLSASQPQASSRKTFDVSAIRTC